MGISWKKLTSEQHPQESLNSLALGKNGHCFFGKEVLGEKVDQSGVYQKTR